MRTRSPSCGPRPPMRSSKASPLTADVLTTQAGGGGLADVGISSCPSDGLVARTQTTGGAKGRVSKRA